MKAFHKILWKNLTHNLPSPEGITSPRNLKGIRDGSHSAQCAKFKGCSIISADLFYQKVSLIMKHGACHLQDAGYRAD